MTLAANAVLNNFLLISAFFLDGLANAAEQLCGRAYGARDPRRIRRRGTSGGDLGLRFRGPGRRDLRAVRAGADRHDERQRSGRHGARAYLKFVIAAPLLGVFAFAYDGVYIGATWARDMRNLMMLSLLAFLSAWLALRAFGNAGLWGALLVHYAARGGLEALRYPALLKASFKV